MKFVWMKLITEMLSPKINTLKKRDPPHSKMLKIKDPPHANILKIKDPPP